MEWILNKLDSRIWTGFIWLMTGTNGGRLLWKHLYLEVSTM
jgi:hypothetical protein